jgi:hypothetical protein
MRDIGTPRESGSFDGWLHSLSADTKDAEYSHTVYEYKYYSTTPGAFFVDTATSSRHNHRERYPEKGYA